MPAKAPQRPSKRAAARLLALLESPSIGEYMDYGDDLKRLLDQDTGDVGFGAIEEVIETSIRKKLPRRDRENASIETDVRQESETNTLVFATKFSIERTHRLSLDLTSIHKGFAKGSVALDIPVTHAADYRYGFRFGDNETDSDLRNEGLLIGIDAMSSTTSLSLPEEDGDFEGEPWAAWHPIRLGKLRAFARITRLDLSAQSQTDLNYGRDISLAELTREDWTDTRSVCIYGIIQLCRDLDRCGDIPLEMHFDLGGAEDSSRPVYRYEKGYLHVPRMQIAEGIALEEVGVGTVEIGEREEGDEGPLPLEIWTRRTTLGMADGTRFRILPNPEEEDYGSSAEGRYDPERDSLQLTLKRLEFDAGDGLVAEARNVAVRHSPRMGKRQPWLAADTLWVRRRGAGPQDAIQVAVAAGRPTKEHLLAVSATGAEIDHATIRKALAAGRQVPGR